MPHIAPAYPHRVYSNSLDTDKQTADIFSHKFPRQKNWPSGKKMKKMMTNSSFRSWLHLIFPKLVYKAPADKQVESNKSKIKK
jgi:hypothetical protein